MVVVELLFFMFMGCSVAALFAAITKTFAMGAAIVCKLMSNGYRVISGTIM